MKIRRNGGSKLLYIDTWHGCYTAVPTNCSSEVNVDFGGGEDGGFLLEEACFSSQNMEGGGDGSKSVFDVILTCTRTQACLDFCGL